MRVGTGTGACLAEGDSIHRKCGLMVVRKGVNEARIWLDKEMHNMKRVCERIVTTKGGQFIN
jgi:hypothetical protein